MAFLQYWKLFSDRGQLLKDIICRIYYKKVAQQHCESVELIENMFPPHPFLCLDMHQHAIMTVWHINGMLSALLAFC